ncbi:MAG: hypothetical protein LCH91_07840 [Bacteroidetes bacterium]|nr:hypothetical protein [Bacteroidota bacterium]
MKNRSFSLIVYLLALTAVMYNCKKGDPLEPDADLVEELTSVKMDTVTLTKPAPVTSTPATVTPSAQATAVSGGVASIASTGTVPATVTTAASEVKAAITPAEVTKLATITPATISTVASGGALPADLKSILDKAGADPKLKAYLPTFTLPTVNGKAIPARTGGVEGISHTDGIDGINASPECIAKGQEAFDAKKAELDKTRADELARAQSAYTTATSGLTAQETTCKTGVTNKYKPLRDGAQAAYATAAANIAAAKSVLGEETASLLEALNALALLGNLTVINSLESAEGKACTELVTASKAAADAAKKTNDDAVNANYQKALKEANDAKTAVIESCHNQG